MKSREQTIRDLKTGHKFADAFSLIRKWNQQGLLTASEYVQLMTLL